MDIELVAGKLAAIGHPVRLRILHLLSKSSEEGRSVGEIVADAGIPASTLSHHLSLLVDAGLVVRERRGTTLFCSLDTGNLQTLASFLTFSGETGARTSPQGRDPAISWKVDVQD